ncbi:MAG: malonyl-CoA synthase [Hyphomicrobiaceae bacterium]
MAAKSNLYASFEDRFARHADKPAFVLSSGTTISYGALAERVARMANALASLGVKPGDRVMAQIEKSIGNVELYLACLKAGAVFNPLNTAYTAAELEYFIADAAPALVVVPEAKRARIAEICQANGVANVLTLEADESGSLAMLAAGQRTSHATVGRAADDMAALLYTSGTTGRSKGAMITHENLSSNAEVLHAYWGFVADDVLIHALPIFHVHGLFVALNTAFLNGSKILWMAKFEAGEFMARMSGASVMMGVPTFYTRLLADPAFGRAHVAHMRLAVSGSAPLLAETHRAFEERTGLRILERYGMTEAGMITSNPYRDGERVAGTVGFALPGVSVRVATPEGQILPAGEVGVLEVKGPNVFKGYWKNPEKTAEEFRPDGYFITGDVSTIAADGRVAIVGRAKDLIISGGFNVYPKEIETEIDALAGVGESAVIGVPHADFGEGVIAVLTAKPQHAAPDEAAVLAALKDRLAKFKLPKRVFVVDELPRNAMGKVQKNELRKTYADTFKG